MSNRHPVDRRTALGLLAGAMALGAAPVAAQPAAAYSRIRVDVSRLRQQGLGDYASFIAATLDRSLRRAFAGRIGQRNAPTLVVRITTIQLASYAGGEGGSWRWGGGGGSSSDYLDGEALVVRGETVVHRHPQLATLPASSGGAWYRPDNEQRRAILLCDAYAQWLARAV
jgi:hypothetical protein